PPDEQCRCNGVFSRRTELPQVDGECPSLAEHRRPRAHHASGGADNNIAALRALVILGILRPCREAYPFDFVAALSRDHTLHVRTNLEAIALVLDARDISLQGDRISVERADAKRVTRISKDLEDDRIVGPRIEPVGAVGHQKMAVLRVKPAKRRPPFLRLLYGDKLFQGLGPVTLRVEFIDHRAELPP